MHGHGVTASAPGGLLVEIAGVAGAGKSSLSRRLSRDHADHHPAGFINARSISHSLRMLRSAPRLLPVLAGAGGPGRRPSWPEVKLLSYVTEWPRVLRGSDHRHGVVLLDQGPLYSIVRLQAQASNVTRRPAFERWCDEMLSRWIHELDAVVWLDAPDDVLWARINARQQSHGTKGATTETGLAFIALYRSLFEQVLERVDGRGPRILRFDTSTASTERIAEQVSSDLRGSLSRSGGGRGLGR